MDNLQPDIVRMTPQSEIVSWEARADFYGDSNPAEARLNLIQAQVLDDLRKA